MEKPGTANFDIYHRTRKFSVSILKYCHSIKSANVDFYLRDQIGRSGTSIGANIHEAKSSSSKKEFCRFYEIALRSCHETLYWLEVINEYYVFDQTEVIRKEIKELINIVSTIVLKIKKQIEYEARVKR